jgi:hypothetical protein
LTREKQKLSTEGVTFRVPSDLLDRLRNESKNKRISLNTLANQIFKEHAQFHSFAAQARLRYFSASFEARLVNGLSEEQLSKIAEDTAKKDFVDLVLLIKGEFTLTAFLDVLETWLTIGGPTSFKHDVENSIHTFVIRHDSGKKFSFLVETVLRIILEEMLNTKTEFITTDNNVVFKIRTDL